MSLLGFLKSNENSRKIFGERELKIIEKQLKGINLSQSEKNRLSRDIRKKFEFIKQATKFAEEFELKKGAENKKIIEEAREVILNDILFGKIRKIIIYGSAAKNKLTFKSDIDIAVEIDKISLKEATLFRKRILSRVNSKIDVQVYNYLPNKIKEEIDKEGKILYKK